MKLTATYENALTKVNCLLLSTTFLLFSCSNTSQKKTDKDPNATTGTMEKRTAMNVADTTYLDVKGSPYKHLGVIPDSLRTPEQKALIKLLNEVTYEYMSVKDNHMVFGLTKEQYVAKGIPAKYYDLLQQNIIDNNNFFDANGIKKVDKMVKETRDQLMEAKNMQK